MAQNIQKLGPMISALSHRSDGMANNAAMNVPGKSSMDMTARVFMAEASFLAASAVSMLASAIVIPVRASAWEMREAIFAYGLAAWGALPERENINLQLLPGY